MKVLHLCKTSEGAVWAMRQMRELVKMGVEVHVAMPLDGSLVAQYREAGIFVHECQFSIKKLPQSILRLRALVREINPDIIQSHFVVCTLIMRIALRSDKRPRLFQVPGPLHLENKFFRWLDIASAQCNDSWIGSCNWTSETYRQCGISENRVFTSIYGGYIMRGESYPPGAIRQEFNLPKDAIIFGMVSFMYPPKHFLGQRRGIKGHEDFIDAISIVAQKYPNVYGVCIGGAWGGAVKYEELVKAYGHSKTDHIIFMGTRTNVPELYADMFMAVHPSHSENLGGAGESLNLGVPTIATNIGGFPDIVIDGKTGILVPPARPDILAERMIECIEGKYPLKEYAQAGQKLVHELCDINNTAPQILEIYKKLAPQNV